MGTLTVSYHPSCASHDHIVEREHVGEELLRNDDEAPGCCAMVLHFGWESDTLKRNCDDWPKPSSHRENWETFLPVHMGDHVNEIG